MPATLGDLEPLYRWLRLRNETDPVEALLQDMEWLSKGKYIKNLREGVHTVVCNDRIDSEVTQAMQDAMGDGEEIFHFHTSFQAVASKMYISVSRVGLTVSKTSLALCINEDDTVNIHFLEPDPLYIFAAGKPTLYGSISTVILADDAQIRNGFIRCETSFLNEYGTQSLLIKCDFRLSRTLPFYLAIDNTFSEAPAGHVGARCQARWEAQCSR